MTRDGHPTDTGCNLAADCLSCALLFCKYDDSFHDLNARDREILLMRREHTVPEIAKEFHLSTRRVHFIIQNFKGPIYHGFRVDDNRAVLRWLAASTWARPYRLARLLVPAARV